jgi:hypothetical protein
MTSIDKVLASVTQNHAQLVKEIASLTDNDLRELIREYQHLQKEGSLPENSRYGRLTAKICGVFGLSFNLKLTESFINTEIYKRFLEKEFSAEEAEQMAIDFGLLVSEKKLPDGPWRRSFRELILTKQNKPDGSNNLI